MAGIEPATMYDAQKDKNNIAQSYLESSLYPDLFRYTLAYCSVVYVSYEQYVL